MSSNLPPIDKPPTQPGETSWNFENQNSVDNSSVSSVSSSGQSINSSVLTKIDRAIKAQEASFDTITEEVRILRKRNEELKQLRCSLADDHEELK